MKYPKRIVKHTSVYRGNLMTFQNYLNTHHFVLPFADRIGDNHWYNITEWYKQGQLIKIEIKRKKLKDF